MCVGSKGANPIKRINPDRLDGVLADYSKNAITFALVRILEQAATAGVGTGQHILYAGHLQVWQTAVGQAAVISAMKHVQPISTHAGLRRI